ncbi:MAG: hypothetical protein E7379_00565 [Clostridiales bacterium]|nr:hypothetical protein [Clostridiales bacterium]
MTKLLSKLPQLINSETTSSLAGLDFKIDGISKTLLQKNFNSLAALAIAYNSKNKFNKLAITIEKPITVIDFLNSLADYDFQTCAFLEKIALAFNIDFSCTDIPSLVWCGNIVNNLINPNDEIELSIKLQELFVSLSLSKEYRDVSIRDLRTNLNASIDNLDEDLGVNKETIQTYLGIAFSSNSQINNFSKWFDYKTFTEMANNNQPINSITEAIELLKNGQIQNSPAIINFIKEKYIKTQTDNDDVVNEYKSSIVLAIVMDKMGFSEIDKYNNLALNLFARIKNIPTILAEKSPVSQITNILNKYDKEAEKIANQILREVSALTEKEQQTEIEKKALTLENYTKKQLNSFNKIIDKKLIEITKTMEFLMKNFHRKAGFAKLETQLELIAEQYNVNLYTKEEKHLAIVRIQKNILKLLEKLHDRYNELNKCKDVFANVRKKMGLNLDIEDVVFDKKLIGTLQLVTGPFHERIIKDFYKLVKADPRLTLCTRFRPRNLTFTISELKERSLLTADNKMKNILNAHHLSPSQLEKYNQDKLEDQLFLEK